MRQTISSIFSVTTTNCWNSSTRKTFMSKLSWVKEAIFWPHSNKWMALHLQTGLSMNMALSLRKCGWSLCLMSTLSLVGSIIRLIRSIYGKFVKSQTVGIFKLKHCMRFHTCPMFLLSRPESVKIEAEYLNNYNNMHTTSCRPKGHIVSSLWSLSKLISMILYSTLSLIIIHSLIFCNITAGRWDLLDF